ncbi:MAG: TetR/AcrR family transcriptional regulator [Anaerostipes sp.]|nr:TetR/AcrR family transcriptional regulator [Anaerostipes sp.]
MPPKAKIHKQDILDKAYELARTKGISGVNARAIAKELNCSVQPIFRNFATMDELKMELVKKMLDTYHAYVKIDETKEKPYMQMGMGYIYFAKEEPELYKILFMSEQKLAPEQFVMLDESYRNVEKYADVTKKLDSLHRMNAKQINDFHTRVWIFTHGLATLVATRTCDFTDEQLEELLEEEVMAIRSLDKYSKKNEE